MSTVPEDFFCHQVKAGYDNAYSIKPAMQRIKNNKAKTNI
jgi:hypothetical protein